MKISFILAAAAVALAAADAQARFIYTETTAPTAKKDGVGTLTDGIWLLNATRKIDTFNLAVNGSKGQFLGSAPSPLNLTEIYSEDGETQYHAVSFTTFSSQSGASGSTLYAYKDMLTEFVAPDCQKTDGAGCFKDCTALTNVQLNATVTSLGGDRAFAGCANLEAFYPRTLAVTDLRISTFENCAKLKGSLCFPNCTSVGGAVFANDTKLEGVTAPNVTVINASAFASCSALTNVVVSESLSAIKTAAFSGCSSLSGDCLRSLLHPGLQRIGSSDTDVKYVFQNCTSFDGELVWNFPALICTNVVGYCLIQGCTSLSKVTFKTDVCGIQFGAFKNIASAAQIYMPAAVPYISGESLGNSAGPFPRVYLKENQEDWITALAVNYHVMPKANFNDRTWSDMAGTIKRTRDDLVTRMVGDSLMCSQDATTKDVSVSQNNVLAFCMQRKPGGNISGYLCFWLLKAPTPGIAVLVR